MLMMLMTDLSFLREPALAQTVDPAGPYPSEHHVHLKQPRLLQELDHLGSVFL